MLASITPRPRISSPIEARMAAETVPTNVAARYGSRFGMISVRMIRAPLDPERRATCT
ncbi:hypothetical protein D3C83_45170 [compost metagenome]